MAKKKTARATKKPATRFTVDLGKLELTDKEVSSLKNKIGCCSRTQERPETT